MDIGNLYRTLLVAGTLSYVAYFIFPYIYRDEATDLLLSYAGYKAIYIFPEWVHWTMFVAWLVAAAGMFLYIKRARTLFLILMAVTFPLSILSGVTIMTAPETLLLDTANIFDGVVIALAYFSSLASRFR